ncbi:MAG: hypothetical protein K2L77_09310 [Muribaculaceae bacterium]|nr:hypothetical protein [Muribaculaceae bacterium]
MNRIFRIAGVAVLCGALICPVSEARGRNERGREPSRTQQPSSRPGNNGHGHQQHNNSRPGNKPGQRPEKPGNGHNRPGKPDRPDRPNTKPGNGHNRPGNGNNRPGPGGPIGSHRPDYRPGRPPQHNHHGPVRPRPPHHGWYRPAPPPHWHAPHHWRPFRSILGISFGTAVNLSVNALINSGYTVSSYNSNSVFVNNVPMLNMMWPDAVLFYNATGGLCGSRFMYSTAFYDMNRYNMTYASLVNTYGSPVSVQSTSSGMEATWWGTGGQFIRLAYEPQYTDYGDMRYYTTLSFGI